jgi:hypothetical protein
MNAALRRADPGRQVPARQLGHRDGDRQPGQQRNDPGERRRRHRQVQADCGQPRHQRRRDEARRQLEHVRRDRQATEEQREQADEQTDGHADFDIRASAAEELTAGGRDDAVAGHAEPPGIGRLLRQDGGDACRAFAWTQRARDDVLSDFVERRQPSQVQLAGLHADQEGVLLIERTEARHDRGRRGEELPDQAQLVAHVPQDVLEAVRGIARGVQRLRQPKHEQDRLVLDAGGDLAGRHVGAPVYLRGGTRDMIGRF